MSAAPLVPGSGLPLVLVAAVASNGVIGGDNRLLWRLPTDLKRFKTRTLGKPLVMGRKTYAAIGRPLPGRETIVLTRDPLFEAEGVFVARTLGTALAIAQERGRALGAEEVVIAGGAELYAQTIDCAERLAITEVSLAPSGDAVFPRIDPALWREARREAGARGPKDEADFSFVEYDRRA